MKEDATAKELESLLKDALKVGIDKPRGDVPIVQLKTVPLDVQAFPKSAPSSARVLDASPASEPQLAEKLAPDSVRPGATRKGARSRTNTFALGLVGFVAVAAAGGSFWFSRHQPAISIAGAATNTNANTEGAASAEGAIKIAISRPAESANVETPPSADSSAPAASAPLAPLVAKSEEPKAVAAPALAVKPAPAPEKTERPKVMAAPAATPPPKTEPKPVAAKKEDPKPVEKAPPPPAPAGGSVDALLQQQLKGAIP